MQLKTKILLASTVISLIIHSIFVISLNNEHTGSQDSQQNNKFPQSDVEVHILSKGDTSMPASCDEWYGGIGINQDELQVVTSVPEGNPAFKAGIRVGDQIINTQESIRGTPGTIVVIELMRNNIEYLKFTIVRAKICEGT